MGMFPGKKPSDRLMTVPTGAKQTFVVRYRGGRKPFDAEGEANAFAEAERSNKDGWAEVSQQVEKVISPR